MALIPLISFTDSSSSINWVVEYDTIAKIVVSTPSAPTSDYVTTETDLGTTVGTVLYHFCDGYDHIKLKADTIFPFATVDIEQNAISCGYMGTTGSLTVISNTSNGITRNMAFEVGPFVPVGTTYYLTVYSHEVSYTAVSGDDASDVVENLIARVNATTAGQWDDHDSAPNVGTPGFKPLASNVGGNFSRFKITLNAGNQFSAGVMGGSQPSFDFDISVATTDETLTGAHDGSATGSVTGTVGTVYSYSLDGLTYQSSNIFTSLTPGLYKMYVKGINGALSKVKSENFIILGSGAINPATIDFPWQETVCYFFKLIRETSPGVFTEYLISEPVKWDAINVVGKRDKDWHGWNYQYSDGQLELEFDCPAGSAVFEAEYQANGNDGVLEFVYGYTYQGLDVVLFPGKINFNTYKRYPQKITATVERKDFNNLFQSRFDTKVSMIGTETIDGLPVAPPAILNMSLHSKEIIRRFTHKNKENISPYISEVMGGTRYITFDTTNAQMNEIEENFLYPIGVSTLAPFNIDKYNWAMLFGGTFNFRISFRMQMITGSGKPAFTFKAFFRINNTATQIGSTLSGPVGANASIDFIRSQNFLNVPVAVGDKIYFYIEMTGGGGTLAINQHELDIVADSLESTLPSPSKGWFLFDTINHTIKTITNNESYLKSSFLSLRGAQQAVDGPGSLFILTNGKQIRQFEPQKHPLKLSAKEQLGSAKAIWCLGLGFETAGLKEVVRVERVNYFYQNNEILVIEECYDYKEEVAKDIIYNEVEIGYDKFQAEGYSTLDEFNTKLEAITPIKTNKLKLVQKSSLIASGYAIETSRRKQYNNSSTDSVTNDDDGFIIAMNRVDPVTFATERNENFDVVNNLISPHTAYNLRVSTKRMLYNWAIWLKNIFYFKAGTEKIKVTEVTQNGDLETQLKATDDRPVGDINKDLLKEEEDVELTNYPVEENLFIPEWVSFKCRLTPDKIEQINRAMRGQSLPTKNYGYIVVKDDRGEYQGVWLYELAYNFAMEKAELKGLKTHTQPVPNAACCKYLTVNGCQILVNGQKIIL